MSDGSDGLMPVVEYSFNSVADALEDIAERDKSELAAYRALRGRIGEKLGIYERLNDRISSRYYEGRIDAYGEILDLLGGDQ
jgi:hypothetical protein